MDNIEKQINRFVHLVGILSAIALIILVFVVAFNAVARYGFSYIAISLEELAWHLNAVVFMLGMSFALHTGHHVRVDIIYQGLQTKYKAWIDLLGALFFIIPFCIVVSYYSWDFMMQSYEVNERSEHPTGLPYRFAIKGLIFTSFSVLLLATISFIIHKVKLLKGTAKPDDMDEVIH